MVYEAKKAGVPLMSIDEFRDKSGERYDKAFTIPSELKQMLEARHNIDKYNSLTDLKNAEFRKIFDEYIHDSRYSIDGDSTTRDTFYNGVY
jgi:hypothetical protein